VSVATTSLEWQEVWDSIDSGTPPPAVDLASEIVATFADGVGSSCPDLDLDDVVIDGANSRIYVVDSNPLGNVPCTADLAGAVVFVVAIERAALPSSPFVVSLTSPDDCTGIPCAAAVEVDLRTPPPATRAVDPTPIAGFSRFEGHNFSFDYPSDWRVIAGFTMYGNGPVVGGAVGIGDFDSGCRWLNEKDLRCDAPSWRIPYEGIVLDYRIEANDGPGPRPSLGPGEQWVDVGGREAVFTETGRSKTWQFSGLPEYIEVHWGAGLAETAPALIDTLIASWQWASLTDR
jgi:hypothetical protein